MFAPRQRRDSSLFLFLWRTKNCVQKKTRTRQKCYALGPATLCPCISHFLHAVRFRCPQQQHSVSIHAIYNKEDRFRMLVRTKIHISSIAYYSRFLCYMIDICCKIIFHKPQTYVLVYNSGIHHSYPFPSDNKFHKKRKDLKRCRWRW
jgi:hypothetical protein